MNFFFMFIIAAIGLHANGQRIIFSTNWPHFKAPLPEPCCIPDQCTDYEIVSMCHFNQEWQDNQESACHEVLQSTQANDTRRAVLEEITRHDTFDQERIWNCTMKDDWAFTEICVSLFKYLRELDNPHANHCSYRRLRKQVEYNLNFGIALHSAELCFYDASYWSSLADHSCQPMAGDAKSNWSLTQQYEHRAYQELIVRDEKDKAFVRHCFLHHQLVKFGECASLIAGSPLSWVKSDKRRARLSQFWQIHEDTFKNCVDSGLMGSNRYCHRIYMDGNYSPNMVQVVKCLYTRSWQELPADDCRTIVYGLPLSGNTTQSSNNSWLQVQHGTYQIRQESDQTRDCFLYHRNDKLPECFGISWNETGPTTPTKPHQKEEWDWLVNGTWRYNDYYPKEDYSSL